jgi:hypothetical protein
VRAIAALALVAALSMPAVTTRLYAADEVEAYAFLRSLWFDGDVSFDNEYRQFYERGVIADDGFRDTFLTPVTETGLRRNFSTIGCALLWMPFYAVTDAGVRVAQALGSPVAADGYSKPYIAAVCYGSACYGVLALILACAAARRLMHMAGLDDAGAAALATWAVWLGSPLVFYMYISPPYTHAVSAFMAAAFVWVWLVVRERWSVGGLAALGALAALMAMVREQDAFLAIGPGLDFLNGLRRRSVPRPLAGAGAFAAAFGLTFLPQAAAYLAINGRIGPSRLVSRKMTWYAPHAAGVLLSPEHGWISWTPLVLIAIAGWLLMLTWRADSANRPASAVRAPAGLRAAAPGADAATLRWIGGCVVLMALSQVWVAGSVESWTVAGAFGQRRFVVLTGLLVIGVAFAVAAARSCAARIAVTAALALCIWWNVGLMVQFGAGLMDRQRLDLPKNAYNTFVTVPRRLPEIAYRYLFERQSFYRRTAAPAISR